MGWVVFDVSALDSFSAMVKGAIGTTVTVILPVFAIVCAILVCIKVVRAFTRG